jgi:hypothetical protein
VLAPSILPGVFKQLVRCVVLAYGSQLLFKLLKIGKPARTRQLGHDVLEWRHARLEGPQHIVCAIGFHLYMRERLLHNLGQVCLVETLILKAKTVSLEYAYIDQELAPSAFAITG